MVNVKWSMWKWRWPVMFMYNSWSSTDNINCFGIAIYLLMYDDDKILMNMENYVPVDWI